MEHEESRLSALEQICQKQYVQLEKKELQIWDVEEENRVLRIHIQELNKNLDEKKKRVDELERWCSHLQKIIDSETEQREKREREYSETVNAHIKREEDLDHWCSHLQKIIDSETEQRLEHERRYQQMEQRYGILFRFAVKLQQSFTKNM